MEKLFTPGPWKAEHVATNSIDIIADEEVIACVDANNGEDVLTDLEWANANLIAAAPDLLEALEAAQGLICRLKLSMLAHPDCTEGSEFDDYTSTAQEMEDSIQAAIAKAYGKEANNEH